MLESYPQKDKLAKPAWDELVPIRESSHGLVPAIVQDDRTGAVLMLGFMNREAFEQTKATGRVTFYSRSRKRLWTKGEASGNTLTLVSMHCDCDRDTLLVRAVPSGPVCHTGSPTCFGPARSGMIDTLAALIHDRKARMPAGSYTTSLFTQGIAHIGAKVMEEAEEVARAARSEGTQRTAEEAADVLFHLLVLIEAAGISFDAVTAELARRRAVHTK
ncbi:MAG: bifunctional phosphoribosyl-AMP cyclohydrolase/phosphoribosyl-ATP diphosphatase HisIE [Deltaproteobacteria bacterium]|nr:bifunctional phosphoribosyl-AMP cyclohydrolase/phosphoribosyl-ATP diphosphatase HisIE [Deltaproteobacteria bacterium]